MKDKSYKRTVRITGRCFSSVFVLFDILVLQYVVLGPRKLPLPLVRVFAENDKIFREEKKYVEK